MNVPRGTFDVQDIEHRIHLDTAGPTDWPVARFNLADQLAPIAGRTPLQHQTHAAALPQRVIASTARSSACSGLVA